MYVQENKDILKPLHPNHNKGVRRQQHGPTLIRSGTLYVTKTPYLLRTKQLICDNPMLLKINKLESIGIDNLDDLNLLRMIICK